MTNAESPWAKGPPDRELTPEEIAEMRPAQEVLGDEKIAALKEGQKRGDQDSEERVVFHELSVQFSAEEFARDKTGELVASLIARVLNQTPSSILTDAKGALIFSAITLRAIISAQKSWVRRLKYRTYSAWCCFSVGVYLLLFWED